MSAPSKTLPDDVQSLRELASAQSTKIVELEQLLRLKDEMIRLMRIQKYGAKSEKLSDGQLSLMDEEPGVHEEIGAHGLVGQEGYAAFTVSATAREGVRQYVANQEEHHRIKSLREELVEMLNKAGVDYDPKYLDCTGHDAGAPHRKDKGGVNSVRGLLCKTKGQRYA